MLSNAFTPSFSPYVCPALIGRVARYTPSSELNIRAKIWHKIIKINFEHLLTLIPQHYKI